ncbi:MAG: hypothetical protein HYV32_03045 [Candidatus Kerfeldbacteria bacterium]|nr:hypothetical protein [Candidatus Kerfeldbacteria bacterium]
MELKSILSVASGILFVVAFLPYIQAIRRREAQPCKATWIIWATLDTITLAGMWTKGTLNGQIIGAVLGAWIVVGLALKYGIPGWSKLDKACMGGAVFGIILWQIFNNPVLGMLTSLFVVFLGSIPTFVSAWKEPANENRTAWTIYWVSCMLALLAIPAWTVADAAQPITFSTIETTMMFILYVKPRLILARA